MGARRFYLRNLEDFSMANTPQAKKRIRRNANRAAINGARVSRIRTFIKAVESAIAVGQEGRCRGSAEAGPAGDGARSRAGRHAQEHRLAEVFAPDQAGRFARLNFAFTLWFRDGPSELPAARFISVTEKSLGIPAIRKIPFRTACSEIGLKQPFSDGIWRLPSVKPVYFTLMKIRLLNHARQTLRNEVSGGESAPGG